MDRQIKYNCLINGEWTGWIYDFENLPKEFDAVVINERMTKAQYEEFKSKQCILSKRN